ncbi:hypothetical protein [Mesorhizobium sp.]|uniref:hypothetical protein n=1 Tax=Mesorhizobium sp. TaxID=1871066 RepID=UPI000FE7D5A9|nr:hypothetical protein [Mesorhizobium sp.]RWE37430.1 MAG: hypothetical protein EOS77_02300 [Mesorhizobium sp.]
MDFVTLRYHVEQARDAMRQRLPITASVHMRVALQIANTLKSPALRSRIFRIRNKIRPHAERAIRAVAADIWEGSQS